MKHFETTSPKSRLKRHNEVTKYSKRQYYGGFIGNVNIYTNNLATAEILSKYPSITCVGNMLTDNANI